jgi:ATP-dependent helicase/nuclease subunit A
MLSNLSRQQKEAVEAATRANVVSGAGAGAGKTYMLVTLLAYLLSPEAPAPLDVEQVVAFTYTEKAAREMKERLRDRINELARSGARQHWRRVRDRLELLSIGTFHSFCQRLVAAYPAEAGVDPAFEVMEEVSADLLLDEVTAELCQGLADAGTPEAEELLLAFDMYGLTEAVPSVVKGLRLRGVAVAEALAQTQAHAGDPGACLADLRTAAEQWLALDEKSEAYQREKAAFAPRWAAVQARLGAGAGAGGASGAEVTASLLDELGRLVNLPAAQGKARKPLVAAMREAVGGLTQAFTCRVACGLLRLADRAWQEFQARKAAQGVLDFDDLVWKARLVLQRPEVRAEWAGRIQKVLVDEFQDTDQLQWEVICLLVGLDGAPSPADTGAALPPGRLFIVGDKKQSIYRFRGAQVEVFDSVTARVLADGGAFKPLQTNYRSRPGVISFVNALFARLGVVATESDAMLVDRAPAPDPATVELLLTAEEGATRTDEALLIADRIRQLVDSGMQVEEKGGKLRPVRYGDFAILLRAMTRVQEYAHALGARGIPHYVVSGRGFYDRQEVQDLINLLQAVVNPDDAVSLLGALRGPAFALRDDTLVLLTGAGRRTLADGLRQAEELLSAGEERDRATAAAALLERLRAVCQQEPAPRALDLVLEATGLLKVVAAQADGEQAVANIRKIGRWVLEGTAGGLRDLAGLVRWLQMGRDREVREGMAGLAEEGDPTTVKLLTVHKAKGLEWPVVVLADASGQARGGGEPVRYVPGKGLALRVRGALGEELPNHLWEEFKEAEKQADQLESLRLFYVAATRARDLLVVSGRPEKAKANTWLKHLEFLYQGASESPAGAPEGWAGGPVRVLTRAEVPDSAVASPEAAAQAAATITPGDVAAGVARVLHNTAPVKATAEVATASSTRLMDLQACARRYYLKYVLGMPELAAPGQRQAWDVPGDGEEEATETVDPLLRGEVLHWICERLESAEQIDALVDQALERFRLKGAAGAQELGAQARAMLQRFTADDLFGRMRRGQMRSEVPFRLTTCGLQLEGRFDALGYDEQGRPLLVDYKTNRNPRVAEEAEHYRLQMSIYVLAARQLGYDVQEAVLYFLESGQAYPMPIDAAAVEAALADLAAVIRRASTDLADYPQNLSHCDHCRYRTICCT